MDDQDQADAAVHDLELTAELCHELNQPLCAVMANLSAGRDRLDDARSGRATVDQAEIAAIFEEAYVSADHMRRLLRATCRGGRRELEVQGRVQLGRVLDEALVIAADEIRGRAQLVCEYVAPGIVLGNELRLRQAFVNLIVNAAQSLPEREPARNWIAVRMWAEQPGRVVVEVQDTSGGLGDDQVGEATRPFFTPRPARGLGLGLTLSKRIVEAHAGQLLFLRRSGGGTRVRVILPSVAEGA
jgi:C4-dicarboxylate-specific signal transduction histidine kinase